MPGKLYKNDIRLSKAYSEGFTAAKGTPPPHPAQTPEFAAWVEGNLRCGDGATCDSESCYKGNAEHTRNAFCDGLGGRRSIPVSAGAAMASWTKAQLKAWLDDHSIDYAPDASKAELRTLAGVN